MRFKQLAGLGLMLALGILALAGVISLRYALLYLHINTKSKGYPDLYTQNKSFEFTAAPLFLTESDGWKTQGEDSGSDGDIGDWPDLKSVSILVSRETFWIRYSLHNHIDINEPMVSLAVDSDEDRGNGDEWYGTVSDFRYDTMITAGYTRKGKTYTGYNFAGSEQGVCRLYFDLEKDSFYLGVPIAVMKEFEGSRFVASVGRKGLWNDDLDSIIILKTSVD